MSTGQDWSTRPPDARPMAPPSYRARFTATGLPGGHHMASLTLSNGDTAARTRRSASSVLPGRDEVVDALALTALTMIGIVGFRPAYGGYGYLTAGAVG